MGDWCHGIVQVYNSPDSHEYSRRPIRPTERSRHATTSAAGDPRSKYGSLPDPMWGKWSLLNCLNFAVFRALWPVYMYALGLDDVCRANGGMTYRHRDVKLTAGPSLWRPNSSPTTPYPPVACSYQRHTQSYSYHACNIHKIRLVTYCSWRPRPERLAPHPHEVVPAPTPSGPRQTPWWRQQTNPRRELQIYQQDIETSTKQPLF